MPGITNPTEKYFKDGLWTFDGTVWRPQNQLLAYRDTLRISLSNTDLAAGNVSVDSNAVPSDEVWIATNFAVRYDGTPPATMSVNIVTSGVMYTVYGFVTPTSALWYDRQGLWIMKAGDLMRIRIIGATLHDDAYLQALGHIFKIAE